MASSNINGKVTVVFDAADRALIKRIADALDRAHPNQDISFGLDVDNTAITPKLLKRLIEPFPNGEGDHVLHDDEHEGEDVE